MTAPEPPALTGIDLLRQRRDALVAASTAATAHAHVDSPATMRAEPGPDPATVLVEPIDYPSGPLAWSQAADTASTPPVTEWHDDDGQDDDADAEPIHDDGRRPLSTALLAFLAAVLAAGIAVAAMMFGAHESHTAAPTPRPERHASAPVAAAPAPVAGLPAAPAPAPAAQPPAPQQHVETPDEYFERALTTGSVIPPISGMDTAHAQAHALCTYLDAAPRTEHELYQYTVTVWPGWSAKQRGAFAGSAINAYCGQYDNLPD